MKPGIKEFTPAIPNDEGPESFSHPLSYVTKKNKSDVLWLSHQGIPALEGRDVKRAVFFAMLMEPILGRYLVKVRMNSTKDAYVTKYIPHLKVHYDFVDFFQYSPDQLVQMRLPFICGVLKMIGETDFHAMNLGVVDEQFILFDTDYWGYFHPFTINYPVAEQAPSRPARLTQRQYSRYGDETLGPHAWPGSRYFKREANHLVKAEFSAPFDALYHRQDAFIQHITGLVAAVMLPSAYVRAVAACLSEGRDRLIDDFVARFTYHQRVTKDRILVSWRFMATFSAHYEHIKENIITYFKSFNTKFQYYDDGLKTKTKYLKSGLLIDLDRVTKKIQWLHSKSASMAQSAFKKAAMIHLNAPIADNGLVHLTCVLQLIQTHLASPDESIIGAMSKRLSKIVVGVCDLLRRKLCDFSTKSLWTVADMSLAYDNFYLQYAQAACFIDDEAKKAFKGISAFMANWLENMFLTVSLPARGELGGVNLLLADRYQIDRIFNTYAQAKSLSVEASSTLALVKGTWLSDHAHQLNNQITLTVMRRDITFSKKLHLFNSLRKIVIFEDSLLSELAKNMIRYFETYRLTLNSIKGLCTDFISLSSKLRSKGKLVTYAKAQLDKVNKAVSLMDFDIRLAVYHVFTQIALIPRPTVEQLNAIEEQFFKLLIKESFPVVNLSRIARVLKQQNIALKREVPFEKIQGFYFQGFDALDIHQKFDVMTTYHRHVSSLAGYLVEPLQKDYASLAVSSFTAIDRSENEILFHSAKEPLYAIARGHESLLTELDRIYAFVSLSPGPFSPSSTSMRSGTPFYDMTAGLGDPKALSGLYGAEVPL